MRAVIVFESIFGNTRAVADAISDGLRGRFGVTVVEVAHAPAALVAVDLLIVGGPIHVWSMAREAVHGEPSLRLETLEDSLGVPEPNNLSSASTSGVREYLHDLPIAAGDVAAATFDTAMRVNWFQTGSAAKPAARRLESHGYQLLAKPEHFYVSETEGPLESGELDRARAWGVGLSDAYVRAFNSQRYG